MKVTLKDWLHSFWAVIVHPSPKTFLHESQKAKGKLFSAIIWLVFLTASTFLHFYLIYKLAYPLYIVLFFFFAFPVVFLFFVFCLDTIHRKVFHRKKRHYDEFLYISTVILVPFTILSFPLNLIPTIGGYLGWAVFIYQAILLIIAIKSIAKLKTWEAAIVVVLSLVLGLTGLFFIPAFIVSIMNTVPQVF